MDIVAPVRNPDPRPRRPPRFVPPTPAPALGPRRWDGTMCVRPLVKADVCAMGALSRRVSNSRFLSLSELAFMRTCYLAWLEAPGSIAIGAVDECGDLLGALLGATDPAAHARAMLVGRRRLGIGAWLVAYAVVHPTVIKAFLVVRWHRYAFRVTPRVIREARRKASSPSERGYLSLGEVSHLFVRLDRQGSGVGRALVDAATEMARAAGVNELVLVTPPKSVARNLCQRLGWIGDGEDRQGRILSSPPAPSGPRQCPDGEMQWSVGPPWADERAPLPYVR